MRTLTAGLHALRRNPLALAPLMLEGVIAGALVSVGAFPASGVSAPAAAIFPFDIYFDLKEMLVHATAWPWFLAALALSVVIRAFVLAATLWLSAENRTSFMDVWLQICRLAAIAVPALLPAAVLLFVGVGVRYAPFVWIGAILGVIPAWMLLRAVTKGKKDGARVARRVPRSGAFLAYAYTLAGFAAAMTISSRFGAWAPALLLLLSAPVHALFLLGWLEHAREGTSSDRSAWAHIVLGVVLVVVFGSAGLDRFVREGGSAAHPIPGSLVLLGGINSTSTTGALSDLDPRRLGFSRSRTNILSYRRGGSYGEKATHGNLSAVAGVVANQIAAERPPVDMIGHSQAALILDRILKMRLSHPDKAALLAAPPPYPPSFTVPRSGQSGPGRVAGDIARPLSRVFELFGAHGFNLDAPAAPFHLKRDEVDDAPISRVAVWALGDSVWLEGDWQRPGERNVVAITDHVGVTNDPRALSAAAEFFANQPVPDDDSSWRGFAVDVLRYVFEPWKPG